MRDRDARDHRAPPIPDLPRAREVVDGALAADDLRGQRKALIDEAAAAIAAIEDLPHPDDPAYET
jgi:hypothetical protein